MGRFCCQHECCGKWVEVGSILHVQCVPAWRRGQWWNDLEVYLVVDSIDTSKVGYLSKDFCVKADQFHNEYIRVTDVYNGHDDDVRRCMKFYYSNGYAKGAVILTTHNMIQMGTIQCENIECYLVVVTCHSYSYFNCFFFDLVASVTK